MMMVEPDTLPETAMPNQETVPNGDETLHKDHLDPDSGLQSSPDPCPSEAANVSATPVNSEEITKLAMTKLPAASGEGFTASQETTTVSQNSVENEVPPTSLHNEDPETSAETGVPHNMVEISGTDNESRETEVESTAAKCEVPTTEEVPVSQTSVESEAPLHDENLKACEETDLPQIKMDVSGTECEAAEAPETKVETTLVESGAPKVPEETSSETGVSQTLIENDVSTASLHNENLEACEESNRPQITMDVSGTECEAAETPETKVETTSVECGVPTLCEETTVSQALVENEVASAPMQNEVISEPENTAEACGKEIETSEARESKVESTLVEDGVPLANVASPSHPQDVPCTSEENIHGDISHFEDVSTVPISSLEREEIHLESQHSHPVCENPPSAPFEVDTTTIPNMANVSSFANGNHGKSVTREDLSKPTEAPAVKVVSSNSPRLLSSRDKSTTMDYLHQVEDEDEFKMEDLKIAVANVRRRQPGNVGNRYSMLLPPATRTSFFWPLNENLRLEDEALKTAESLLKSMVNVVNDDGAFPDSVTPTKVDQHLVENGGYDIPYMDDAAFFCGAWYGGEDHRWSQLYLSEADLRLASELAAAAAADKVIPRKAIPTRSSDPSQRHSVKLASHESLTEAARAARKKPRRGSFFTNLCKCTRRQRE